MTPKVVRSRRLTRMARVFCGHNFLEPIFVPFAIECFSQYSTEDRTYTFADRKS